MAIGYGFNAWMGFGSEATYGTPVTRTQFLEINSESLAVEDDVVEGNSTYLVAKKDQNWFQGRKKVSGAVEFDCRVAGAERIFRQALGTCTTTAVGTIAAHGSLHTFGMTPTLPAGLTMEVNRDVASFIYHGCKINQFTLDGDSEGILKVNCDIIAEDEGTVAASTPTFSSSAYYNFSQCALTIASGTRNVESFKVTVNNNLDAERFMLGARTIKEPLRTGRVEVSGEITMEFPELTDWTTFQTAGTGALVATYTGAVFSGTIANYLKVTMPYMRFKGVPVNVDDSGKITVTVPFEAYATGTTVATMPLKIEMVNTTNGTDIYN